MSLLNILVGVIIRVQRVVIYGPEGIGKSTLASQCPDPLFIDLERGTDNMNVRRVYINLWYDLIAAVKEIAAKPDCCKTLVVDTADKAEELAAVSLCKKHNMSGIEDFGYGKGYTYLADLFKQLLDALDTVIAAGINVIVVAHGKMRKFEQPDEAGAYDCWEMQLTKQVMPELKEWCDALLFCNYKTHVIQSSNVMEKAKVSGGERVIYTTHHPCWDAKNRHDLPDELPMKYESIAPLFGYTGRNQLQSMMDEARVSEADIRKVVAARGQYPEDTPISEYSDKFINDWLIKHWSKVVDMIHTTQNTNSNQEETES